jgi:hypothetical protein
MDCGSEKTKCACLCGGLFTLTPNYQLTPTHSGYFAYMLCLNISFKSLKTTFLAKKFSMPIAITYPAYLLGFGFVPKIFDSHGH